MDQILARELLEIEIERLHACAKHHVLAKGIVDEDSDRRERRDHPGISVLIVFYAARGPDDERPAHSFAAWPRRSRIWC